MVLKIEKFDNGFILRNWSGGVMYFDTLEEVGEFLAKEAETFHAEALAYADI